MVSNHEKHMLSGRNLFLEYNPDEIAKKLPIRRDQTYLYIEYLTIPYRIGIETGLVECADHGSFVEDSCFDTIMTIYDILCYSGSTAPLGLTGQWTLIRNLSGAVTSPTTTTFTRKYASLFDGNTSRIKEACLSFGGEVMPQLAGADLTIRIPVFPFFPVLLQFWNSDEEFPAQLKLLWDKNSIAYMHFETTYYLQNDLLRRIADYIST